jgi:hypothetical protein
LKWPSDHVATRRATAKANSLAGPETNVSNEKRAGGVGGVGGGVGGDRRRARRRARRASDGACGFQLHARLQVEPAAQRIVLRPDLADAAPGMPANPVARDARGGHDADLLAIVAKRRLAQPGAERRVPELALENLASLRPDGARR